MNNYSTYELLVFALGCILGLGFFLIGYGYDVSPINSSESYFKGPAHLSKKIKFGELFLFLLFIIICFVFRNRLIKMIVNFGESDLYASYAIRAERTRITGVRSALASYFTLVFLSLPFYRSYKEKKIHALDIFIYVIVFVYAFLAGDRTNLVLAALLLAVLVNSRFFHLKVNFIIFAAILGTLVLVLVGHLRKYNNFESMWRMINNENLEELLSLTSSGEFKNTTGTMFSYIHAYSNGKSFYNFGYIYLLDIIMYIPTFIFPSRPLPPQEQYMHEFFPSAASGTGHGWFILTDGYIAFGVIGIVIEMYSYGKLLKYTYRKYFENNKNPLTNYLYVYFLLYVFYSIRSSVMLSIKNYIIAVLPVLVILTLEKYFNEKSI